MYYIEVRIRDPKTLSWVWSKLRPTHGRPYEFASAQGAVNVMDMCYPSSTEKDVRVVEGSK